MIKKYISIKSTFLTILIFFISVSGVKAQALRNEKKEGNLVGKKILKLLSGNSDISPIIGLQDIYSFNFRIVLEKKSNQAVVVDINATDSVGYKVFPMYKDLMNLNYNEVLLDLKKATLVIPILILNDSFDRKNPDENLKLTKHSISELILNLIYEKRSYQNLYDDDVILFKPIIISRMDIK